MKPKDAKDQVPNLLEKDIRERRLIEIDNVSQLSNFASATTGIMFPDELPDDIVCWEGAKSTICVNRW